jgi:hypothetical protein
MYCFEAAKVQGLRLLKKQMEKNGLIRFTPLYISYIYLIYNPIASKQAYRKKQRQRRTNRVLNERNY